jgi:acyl-coenzyme A thioesterase PaaI-like protein
MYKGGLHTVAHFATNGPTVTIAFNSEFLGARAAGTPIYARARRP